MNLFLYLLLAHFLADYPLQPNRLVHYKLKRFSGVLLHSLVHLIVVTLILFPFWHDGRVWIAVATIFVTHNLIDQAKISLNRLYPRQGFTFYLLDQLDHLIVLALVAYFLPLTPIGPAFYLDQSVVLYVLILLFVTYVYDVTRWTHRNAKNPQPYQRDYRMMLLNVLIVSVAFGIYWLT